MAVKRDGTEPIIAHGSVYLRAAEREDIPLFVRWMNDYRTSRTLRLGAPLSIPMEEQFFDHVLGDQGKTGWFFVACLLADDRPIGSLGLFDLHHTDGSAGLGISIGDPADTGHGHGTDMMRALLAFAFDTARLHRVWLDVYDSNSRARRVYERLGFVHEGVLRDAVFREGRYVDVHRMSILEPEYRARAVAREGASAADPDRSDVPAGDGVDEPAPG